MDIIKYDILPTKEDFEKIISAKVSYEAAAKKGKEFADAWNKKNFIRTPWGIAYNVSKAKFIKSVASTRSSSEAATNEDLKKHAAVRAFIVAAVIDWTDLTSQLKRTLSNWGFSAEEMRHVVDLACSESNIISKNFNDAIRGGKIKLTEAIEKHETLNSKLFSKDNVLKAKVRNKLLEIVDVFISDLKEQDIKIKVDDILLIGSNASYNYTKDSDIDLHILTNTKAVEYPTQLANAIYSAYRSLFNKQLDISIYDIPLEIFVETEESSRVSNGVYSVKKDKWLKKPVQEDIPEYDKIALDKLVSKWEARYKNLLKDIEADKLKDESKVIKLIEEIYEKLRKKGVAKGEYAIENLAFKELRNKGYLDKLKEYRNKLTSKRLSLEERLDRSYRATVYDQIARAAGSAPMIQDNGMFYIYNLKATDVTRAVQALRALPFVTEVQPHESGKYDFSRMAITNLPTKYYNIRGQITITD